MKGGKRPQGYTILETMIFLAVTSALFVSVSLLVSGKQRNTEFNLAVRETQSKINDILNDASTGYYYNTNNFKCTVSGGAIQITSGTGAQGQNTDCVYMGKAIQFAPSGQPSQLVFYNIVAKREDSTGKDPSDYIQARPQAIAPRTLASSIPDATELYRLPGGLKVESLKYCLMIDASCTDIGTVAFMSKLASYSTSGLRLSGSQSVDVVPINKPPSSLLGQTKILAADDLFLSGLTGTTEGYDFTNRNPIGGVIVCFSGEGSNNVAKIKISGGSRRAETQLTIEPGPCT